MNKVGTTITRLRQTHNWSQSELARRARLRQSHVQQMEKGTLVNPNLATLEKLASAFGMPTYELVRLMSDPARVGAGSL